MSSERIGSQSGPSPSWDFPRSASGVRVALKAAEERGIAAERGLLGSGLSQTDLVDPGLEVEASQELIVIRNLVHGFDDAPGIGSHVGKRITLGSHGILGLAMVSSQSACDAIDVAVRFGYGKLAPLFLRPRRDELPAALNLIYDESEVPVDVRPFVIERDLTLCVSFLRVLFGAAPPASVSTTLDGPHGYALARSLAGWTVELGRDRNAIIIDSDLLTLPLPNADEYTARECERHMEEILARRGRSTSIAERVRSAMLGTLATTPSITTLADARHVDPRTLRRQLAAEGTSFRTITNEVRKTRAIQLLSTGGLSVNQVAAKLGYADQASFTRAFKRWTGTTPSAYAARARS
ncbi:helix-turn-helix domain-containing protein [Nocardia fusca]|uniref:helix-turn-helix domain-containing protein n=1 Tax=Nocardia fusca TaxID=941183 RepID=UPI0037C7B229